MDDLSDGDSTAQSDDHLDTVVIDSFKSCNLLTSDLLVSDRAAGDAFGVNRQLHKAILDGDLLSVETIIALNPSESVAAGILISAVVEQNPQITKVILEKCSHVNKLDSEGRTVLHEAIVREAVDCAHVLLCDQRVNIDIPDNQGWSPLFWAVNRGLSSIVEKLLKLKCQVNIRDLSGNTALHEAAECGYLLIVQLLIQAGCEINARNFCGETAVLLATVEGHHKVIQFLIDYGADVNIKSDTGASALLYTAICGNTDIAKVLLDAGAEVDSVDSEGNTPMLLASKYGHVHIGSLLLKHFGKACNLSHMNLASRSALHAAAENNHGDVIEILLLHGMDAALADHMGKTALSLAAQQGHLQALRPLVKTKIGVNSADFISMTPLHWAVVGGHTECVQELLRYEADADIPNAGLGNTPLILAVDCGHLDIVRLLIGANCNVNAVNTHERSALHEAAERGCVDMIDYLLPAGAFIDMQSSKGDTPLIIATRRGHTVVVEHLLDVNCDVHFANSNHTTALHEACLWGHQRSAEMLLHKGAEIDLAESEGDTPLILACTKGHIHVVQLLLESGCNVDCTNDMDRSALMEAAEHGFPDIVEQILSHDADVSLTDTEGDSALTLAAGKGHPQVVSILLEAGSSVNHINRWGRNALHEACALWTGPTECVPILLGSGMNPDLPDKMSNTPLILATLSGREETVLQLIRANCDINKSGQNVDKAVKPIQIAVTKENFCIAQMLYLAGCDMNAVNVWIESSNGPLYLVPVKNNEMKEWLQRVTQTPLPLKLVARVAVRNIVSQHRNMAHSIRKLPLPSQLISFLLLDDLTLFVQSSTERTCPQNEDTDSGSEDEDILMIPRPDVN